MERSFFRTEKNVTYGMEKNGVPNPVYNVQYILPVSTERGNTKIHVLTLEKKFQVAFFEKN